MLSFVNRQILGLLVAPVKQDLHITDTQVGLLQGLAFASFYTLVGLPLGRVADLYNRRNLIAVGVLFWSLMTAASAIANSYHTLFAVRMGVGIGEAALGPAAFSIIADYFAKKRFSLAMSVYSMGIYIGTGLAFLVGGLVVDAVVRMHTVTVPILGTIASWRVTFLAVGLPGFLFVPLLYTIKEPPRRNVMRSAAGTVSHANLGQVIREATRKWRSVLGISVGAIFQSLCAFAYFNWGPTFFIRTYHWTAGQAGRALGPMLLTLGCLGMFAGGWISDRWQQKGVHEAPLKVTALSAIGTGVPFVAAMFAHTAAWSLVFVSIGIIFVAMPVGSTYAAVQYIFPNQMRGQVTAFLMFVLNLGGISLGGFLPGFFNNHLFHNESAIGASIALTIGGGSILQFILFSAIFGAYRRDYAEMHPTC